MESDIFEIYNINVCFIPHLSDLILFIKQLDFMTLWMEQSQWHAL